MLSHIANYADPIKRRKAKVRYSAKFCRRTGSSLFAASPQQDKTQEPAFIRGFGGSGAEQAEVNVAFRVRHRAAPERKEQLRRLLMEDSDFRHLGEDYRLVTEMIAEIDGLPRSPRPRSIPNMAG